ncbi:MAG: NAD-dependent epimerase/dehydratase family protein [Myxococcales bacterium]|nr:MAG: NAD-dependent epimerase/dehydratase family protein [Myxococcales bacterium]
MKGSRRRPILLTGITGFIGGALAVELVRAGHDIAAVVRATDERAARARVAASLSRFIDGEAASAVAANLGVAVGDLAAAELYEHPLFDRASHVVHAAGCTSFATKAEVRRANVEGTARLAQRMLRAPALRRFLHVGTAYSCGDRPAPVVYEEDAPRQHHRHVNEYARSKAAAELLLAELGFGERLLIARPSIVIGHTRLGVAPSSSLFWYCRAMAALRRGPFDLEDARDIVPVDYVAEALAFLLLRESPRARTYHVSAGRAGSRSLREMLLALGWREGDGWQKVSSGALLGLRSELRPLVRGELEARQLASGLGACAKFGELGVQYFDNARLLSEGFRAPPSFVDYAGVCLESSGSASLFEQMVDEA